MTQRHQVDGKPRNGSPGFPRRHGGIVVVLLGGAVVRGLMMVAYPPAFWFLGDSGMYVAASTMDLQPGGSGGSNGIGYPALLTLLRPTGNLASVSLLQHLAGLGLALAIYVFLLRRGLPTWLAVVAVIPTTFDGAQLTLEHYLLSETLFTTLLVTAVLTLMWRDRPGVAACAVAGLTVVAAVLTRSVGAPVGVLLLVYLIIRGVGWTRVLAFALALAAPLAGYLMWVHAKAGVYAFSTMQGHYLYSRTATIADCDRLRLTDEQRGLCPRQPLGERPERGDWYLWNDPNLGRYSVAQDPFVGDFAKQVILQQPGDFAELVITDTAKFLLPGQEIGPKTRCLAAWWMMPGDLWNNPDDNERCKPLLAGANFSADPADPANSDRTELSALRNALNTYSGSVRTPQPLLGLTVLAALAAAVWRVRRPRWRDGLDALAWVGVGLTLMVVAVATSMYDVRYGIPSVTFMAVGGALAVHRVRTTFAPRRPPQVAVGNHQSHIRSVSDRVNTGGHR